MRFIKVIPEFDISGIGVELAEQYVKAGFCESKSAFRRMVKQNAVRVADRLVTDPFARIAHDNTEWILVEHAGIV